MQKWVSSRDGRRVEGGGGLGPGAGKPRRHYRARRPGSAACRKSRWRCGPLPALPRKPPPADTRPRKVRGPSRGGGGASSRARFGLRYWQAPRAPEAAARRTSPISAASPPPPARGQTRTPDSAGLREGRGRGPRRGGGRPGEPRADPRKEGEPGRGESSSGEGAPEGNSSARGVGARLGPPRGWGPRRTGLPHPSRRGRGPSGS